jgi:AraC family transcriptional regulator, transcriptional activator of pobA
MTSGGPPPVRAGAASCLSWYCRRVTQLRPFARDIIPATGGPITVEKRTRASTRAACRTPISHGNAVVALYTGGQLRMELNGEHDLRAGDLLLVPAGQPHRALDRRPSEFWGLSFYMPSFAASGAESLLEPFERVRDGASPGGQIPAARQGHLQGLFEELERVGREPRPSDSLGGVQSCLLTLILADVEQASRSRVAGAPRPGPARHSVVGSALRFIERNCLGQLTLGAVAAAVGRSPAYVTTALTRATGRSAVQWMVSGRMAEARRLLLHSDERVDVVAERVGYADATHFIRMFRREHGSTPAAWRAEQLRAAGSGG